MNNNKYGTWTQNKKYNVITKDEDAYFVKDDNNIRYWVWTGSYFIEQ